jgi:hypothetical protein
MGRLSLEVCGWWKPGETRRDLARITGPTRQYPSDEAKQSLQRTTSDLPGKKLWNRAGRGVQHTSQRRRGAGRREFRSALPSSAGAVPLPETGATDVGMLCLAIWLTNMPVRPWIITALCVRMSCTTLAGCCAQCGDVYVLFYGRASARTPLPLVRRPNASSAAFAPPWHVYAGLHSSFNLQASFRCLNCRWPDLPSQLSSVA